MWSVGPLPAARGYRGPSSASRRAGPTRSSAARSRVASGTRGNGGPISNRLAGSATIGDAHRFLTAPRLSRPHRPSLRRPRGDAPAGRPAAADSADPEAFRRVRASHVMSRRLGSNNTSPSRPDLAGRIVDTPRWRFTLDEVQLRIERGHARTRLVKARPAHERARQDEPR